MANTSVIVIPEGKICDYVDGKFRNDTPEEYVRQTIEKRLVNEHKYLPKQIRIEYTLQLGSRKPRADTMADYNIFMAMVEKVGHDKRGNPTFKRDKEGNEILVPDTNSVLVLGTTGEGNRTVSHEQKRKVEDDQTPDVPAIFAEWKIKEGLAW